MSYVPKNHPVRQILDRAASGRMPTKAELDRLEAFDGGLPDGEGLARFRTKILAAAHRCQDAGLGGAHQAGREQVDLEVGVLGDSMTDAQRAVDEGDDPNAETVGDIGRRMFSN